LTLSRLEPAAPADAEGGEALPGAARLVVEDTGIGIAAEALPRIFQMFHQEEAGTERRGLGIGLALVEALVQKHGGQVWAASDGPGRGSRFTIELPLAPATGRSADGTLSATGRAGECSAAESTPSPQVLLVEDGADSRETMAEVLQLLGYQVRAVATAEEALALLAGWRPDAILSDIGLPETDGYALMRQVRQIPGQDRVVAVAITGYGTRDDREAALAAGFDAHVAKPLDVAALSGLLSHRAAI
jgi:CheY-like chemotaxis protein